MPTAAIKDAALQSVLRCPGGKQIRLRERPLIMGVLNITPDSFSDGALWIEPRRAIGRALEMVREGAELLDLGAESTRPGGGVYGGGAEPVDSAEELRRLLPVLQALKAQVSVPISVDTRKGAVAAVALHEGADLINDISALADPDMARVVASSGCPVVLMHSRGSLEAMQRDIHFNDVIGEIRSELEESVERALSAGVRRDQILVDPGIGFGKKGEQNLEILRRLDDLQQIGRPILIGASRKSFIGEITGAPPAERLAGSLAAVAWAAHHGAAIVRVHDVGATAQFLQVWQAISCGMGDRD